MLASRLTAMGLSPLAAKGSIVLVLALVAGLLSAEFPSQAWLPPILAFVTGLSALVDPNASH